MLDRIRDERLEAGALLLRDERAELDVRVRPVADPELGGAGREPLDEVS